MESKNYTDPIFHSFRRDGKFYVNTDGADGKLRDFEIKYAFGLTPLQQYLVEFPDGRIQALSIAWDARARAQGGQRWFHLYPGQAIKAGDRLHWTGIDQNWNHQCAECHSTNLRKNFNAQANTFRTTWSEINVACEACHGPGSNHAAWAKKEGDWQRVPGRGMAVALDERRGAAWVRKEGEDTAERSKPRDTQREIETCARCHARRGQLTDDYVFGRPLADTHRASLLQEGLYWPDGQQRDEVYTYASFLQSEMYGKGVTCSDCHEPHSLKLRAPGNAVRARCHQAAKFDTGKHTHHAAGTPGAQCAACHMPTTTYMGVDPRHDHSLRIPRPDRSVSMGVPNACNQCHKERSAQWSAEQIGKWSPQPLPGHQRFAEALHAGNRTAADARKALLAAAEDRRQPAVARASAIALLAQYPDARTMAVLRKALDDIDPMVRGAAVNLADLYRSRGDEKNAEATLRAALKREPAAAPLHYALGLSLVRQKRVGDAVAQLRQAAKLATDQPRYAYVYGVALYSSGRRAEGIQALADAHRRFPGDPELLQALATMERDRGDRQAAAGYARKLFALTPDDAQARALLQELQR